MTAIDRLHLLKHYTTIIGNSTEAMEKWFAKATKSTTQISGEGHGTGISDKVGDNVVEYLQLEDDISYYIEARKGILKELAQLATEYYDILYNLYAMPYVTLLGDALLNYAEKCNRSKSWAEKMRAKAIKAYQEVIE